MNQQLRHSNPRILVLEGGGVLGLSALIILQAFMERLSVQLDSTNHPRDFFDLIVGTGPGGISALLLGAVGMSVEEVIQKYVAWKDTAFKSNDKKQPLFRKEELEKELQTLIQERLSSKDAPLKDSPPHLQQRSKTAALAALKDIADAPPYVFRNYTVPTSQASNNRVWEVARATSASPNLFSPITFGSPPQTFISTSSTPNNNPCAIALSESRALWPDKSPAFILSIGSGLSEVISMPGNLEGVRNACQKMLESCEPVHNAMFAEFSTKNPQVYFRFNANRGFEQGHIRDWDQIPKITGLTNGYLLQAEQQHALETCMKRFLESQGKGQNIDPVFTSTEKIREKRLQNLHGKIKPVSTTWDEEHVCHPGTRTELLEKIMAWAKSKTGERVYWLFGPAGIGKSTVAHTLVRDLLAAEQDLLGAFFSSFRTDNTRNQPHLVLPAICYELATRIPLYAISLSHLLKAPYAFPEKSPKRQMEELFIKLDSALQTSPPCVIVLDGLDECGNEETRGPFLQSLEEKFPKLPTHIKLFIASRDERDIRSALTRMRCSQFFMDARHADNLNDVATFLTYDLVRVRNEQCTQDPDLDPKWLSDKDIRDLIKKAQGHFIWAGLAASLLRYTDTPNDTLKEVLSRESFADQSAQINQMYMVILDLVSRRTSAELFQAVVGPLLILRTPMLQPDILGLIADDRTREKYIAVINRLRAVLLVDHGKPIEIVHTSFTEFITTARCTKEGFRIDISKQNDLLAARCFKHMEALRRDLCNIGSANVLNNEVQDLQLRLDKQIPSHLRYACSNWLYHLSNVQAKEIPHLIQLLDEFLFNRLLFWIEAMSLLSNVSGSLELMKSLEEWLKKRHVGGRLATIAREAVEFITEFQPVLEVGALHTYYSALPFTSPTTLLSQTFVPKHGEIPRVVVFS